MGDCLMSLSQLSVAVSVTSATGTDAAAWDRFVDAHPEGTNYHRWGWKQAIENAFGWTAHYLVAKAGDQIAGILPLIHQKSRLFGSFITSVPFVNAGGVLSIDPEPSACLVQKAIEIASESGARYIQLRHRFQQNLGLRSKTHKITLVRPLEPDTDKMFAKLDKKLRSDIRKGTKCGLTTEVGGLEYLDDFYSVFTTNMRDLGTPTYSRRWFAEVIRAFPEHTFITVVRHEGKAVASSFLTGYRDVIEAAWSSSLRQYLHMRPNMLLYWHNLCVAAQKNYSVFDFGRSSVGSGTHKFKLQWDSVEKPLYWDYWVADGQEVSELSPQNPKYRAAVWMWQHLPLTVANRLGPPLVKRLP